MDQIAELAQAVRMTPPVNRAERETAVDALSAALGGSCSPGMDAMNEVLASAPRVGDDGPEADELWARAVAAGIEASKSAERACP